MVDPGQLQAIALALVYIKMQLSKPERISQLLDLLNQNIIESDLDTLGDCTRGDLAQFRPQEFMAALNRLRSLKIQ